MSSWTQEELSSIDLGDERLNRRCQKLLGLFAQNPGKSIPESCGSWSDTLAAYRLFGHKNVTMERILEPHIESSCKRMADEPVVLCIGDTTQLDFTSMPETDGLGPLARDFQHGLYLHPIIAVTPERLHLGVIDACLWARDLKSFGVKRSNRPKGAENRESYRWIYGYNQLCALAKRVPNTRLVYITDREGDITDLLAEAQSGPVDLLIRAAHDRNIEGGEKLYEHMCSQKIQGSTTFELPSGPGRAAREVIQKIRFDSVQLRPAHPDHAILPEITVNVVFAREESPPVGIEPIEWMLLSTKPVSTLKQALTLISWYRCRWEVETFFRTLKTGCRVERLQLTTADRLKPAIALFLVITWRILHFTRLGRVSPDAPATIAFSIQECELVCHATKMKITGKSPPLLRDMIRMIAQLGGFLGRSSDGDPGPKSIWNGMQRLRDFQIGRTAVT